LCGRRWPKLYRSIRSRLWGDDSGGDGVAEVGYVAYDADAGGGWDGIHVGTMSLSV